MISEQDASPDMPQAQLANQAEPLGTHGPDNAAAQQHAQQLFQDIATSTMALRVCMQCLGTLLDTLGHPVPKHVIQDPAATQHKHSASAVPPEGNSSAAAPARSDTAATVPEAGGSAPADRAARGDESESVEDEDLEFEDVDWEEQAAAASAVADTMSAAPRREQAAQPGARRLPRRIRSAIVAALRCVAAALAHTPLLHDYRAPARPHGTQHARTMHMRGSL